MLSEICRTLDGKIELENRAREKAGTASVEACELFVIGQSALLEVDIGITLTATVDVDLYHQIFGYVRRELEKILERFGRQLDPVGHEAWMPEETEFASFYRGRWVHCQLALPEYVLISKAKMALERNRGLLVEYIGGNPSELFFQLVKKYEIDLEAI